MLKLMKGQRKQSTKYKFGIQIPRNVKQALEFDKANNNHLWEEAMKLEVDLLKEFELSIYYQRE